MLILPPVKHLITHLVNEAILVSKNVLLYSNQATIAANSEVHNNNNLADKQQTNWIVILVCIKPTHDINMFL